MLTREAPLRELVRETLLKKIGAGQLGPGERIVEAALAEELGVSSIPVREAIRELVSIRVLEFAPHRGAWVRKVSLRETIEALRIRAVLEPMAAPAAAAQSRDWRANLRRAVQSLMAAARSRDFVALQEHNQRFHRMIVEAAGNCVLLRLWDSMAFEIRTRFVLEYLTSFDPAALARDHELIFDAIDRGDAKRTARLLKSHSRNLVRYLKQQQRLQEGRACQRTPV
jgi:DNA-binding GntR family transcriptional regulator